MKGLLCYVRYAYHLRRWALEGQGIGSHAALGDKSCSPVRVVVQPAGMSERACFDLLNIDYVADLRAEVAKWWESLVQVSLHINSYSLLELSEIMVTCVLYVLIQIPKILVYCIIVQIYLFKALNSNEQYRICLEI